MDNRKSLMKWKQETNKIMNTLKYMFGKILDGFLGQIGTAIAILIGSFLGAYWGGQKASETVVEELAKRDSTLLVMRDSTFIVNRASDFAMAKEYELKGFQSLVDKDFDEALAYFIASENSANQYHSSYEIAQYLRKNKESVSEPDFWERTYQFVIAISRSYIPSNYLEAMEESLHSN